MTTDQSDCALGHSTSTDKMLSLRLSKTSHGNQSSNPSSKRNPLFNNILTIFLSIHRHFTKTLSSATLRLTRTHYQHGKPPIFRSRRFPSSWDLAITQEERRSENSVITLPFPGFVGPGFVYPQFVSLRPTCRPSWTIIKTSTLLISYAHVYDWQIFTSAFSC